jgi:hypothetical protein
VNTYIEKEQEENNNIQEDDKMLKKKTSRKKLKNNKTKGNNNEPIRLEEMLEQENQKNGRKEKEGKKPKSQKTQNVNISNTNPYIINQNNFYNGYGMASSQPPRFFGMMNNPRLDIPDPTKFLTDKSLQKATNYNFIDPNYLMNMQRMPIVYYPGFVVPDYGFQQQQQHQGNNISKK